MRKEEVDLNPTRRLAFSSLVLLAASGGFAARARSTTLEDRKAKIKAMDSNVSPEQIERKLRSEKRLAAEGVPLNKHLPAIESEAQTRRRTKEEIATRAMALLVVSMHGSTPDKAIADKIVGQYGLANYLTPREREFIAAAKPSDRDRVNFSWRFEAAHVLFWALGYVEKLDKPTEACDPIILIKPMKSRTAGQFIADAKLRSLREILDNADLIYRYRWALVDARVNDRAEPAGLNGSVALERHVALNWLIGYMDQEWDDISTDT
jgi:hypothetical protein